MDRAEKMDSRANGEVILTRATTKFQLKKGLTRSSPFCLLVMISLNLLEIFFPSYKGKRRST